MIHPHRNKLKATKRPVYRPRKRLRGLALWVFYSSLWNGILLLHSVNFPTTITSEQAAKKSGSENRV